MRDDIHRRDDLDDLEERLPLRAEEEEESGCDVGERLPEAPLDKGPSRGIPLDRMERSPGSLHGDERGGQRPKKPRNKGN